MENIILKIALGLVCFGGFIYLGVCCLFFPRETRDRFLSYYSWDQGIKPSNPRTWFLFKPNEMAFRIAGVVLFLLGIFTLFTLILGIVNPNY